MYQSSQFHDKKDAFSGNIKYFSHILVIHVCMGVRAYMDATPLAHGTVAGENPWTPALN